MLGKTHKAQGVLWVIVIIAIVALLLLWISKKPVSVSTTASSTPNVSTSPTPTPNQSVSPTSSLSLDDIGTGLKDLNSSATSIDNAINDTQLDVMN